MENEVIDYRALRLSLMNERDSLVFRSETSELKKIIGGVQTRDKLRGIFTRDKYKRLALLKEGFVVFARVLEAAIDRFSDERSFKTRILFSPSDELSDQPEILEKIFLSVSTYIDQNLDTRKKWNERRLYLALCDREEEPKYYRLPDWMTDSKLVYLSTVFISPVTEYDCFDLPKLIPIMINRRLSREVLIIPPSMYSPEYREFRERHRF